MPDCVFARLALAGVLLAGAGIGAGEAGTPGLPERTAGINAILNVCPPELAERVLIEYFNRIYVPPAR